MNSLFPGATQREQQYEEVMRPAKVLRLSGIGLATLLAGLASGPAARANVFASNIKLNGALSSVTNATASPVTISYILNEPATMGTTIKILSGASVVDTISIASGSAGTLKGTNAVVWGGTNSGGGNVPGGTYSVSITASASGFANWTQTSTDTNAGNYVYSPRGIAVDTSTNSLYYGRVFLANAATGPNPGTVAGDVDGIIKVNADGSLADEGQGNAGYNWIDDGYNDSPHCLRYGTDDRIYGLDWTGPGVVIACDVLMTTNQEAFGNANWQNNPFASEINGGSGWSCFDVVRPETTNGWIFMGDNDYPGGAGYWGWQMAGGEANPTNSVGTQLVTATGDLLIASGGLMVDVNSNAYVAADRSNNGDTNNRVMLFTNWNGVTAFSNGSAWKVGGSDNTFRGNYDVAIDSRTNPKYVALPLANSGGIRVLNASNGLVVSSGSQVLTNLDYTSVTLSNQTTNVYWGACWDAVGNLYGAGNMLGATNTARLWREFSPPGTNQATTVAVETIQVGAGTPLQITSIHVSGGTVTINFTGATSDTTSNLFVLSSGTAVPASGYTTNGASITQQSPGVFQATLSASGSVRFYRLER